jgi:streptogramin lyase
LVSARVVAAVLVVVVVAVASVGVYEVYFTNSAPTCQILSGPAMHKSQTTKTTFGAVTEYTLPAPDRWADAVTMAPDGSVWFAEQEVPGVAHLYPTNGTLVEYQWPGYAPPSPPDCVPSESSSGIALWNGKVWAADEFGNVLWGVNPSNGSTQLVNVTGKADFPYWLSVGPDGDLWFTSDNLPAVLGRVQTNMSLQIIPLNGMGSDEPLQIDFVNSTLAYISAINLSTNSTTHGCVCNGHVYSFDPGTVGQAITPEPVGAGYNLQLPTSVSYSAGSIYVAEHEAASLARFDYSTGGWTKYPTSLVPWSPTTLPYVVQATGSTIWFNEHYANKIALLNPALGTLTEYSESNPPITSFDGVQNDVSITPGANNSLWFTSMSGNYVGLVDGSYYPGFGVSAVGTNAKSVAPGGTASFELSVTGSWTTALRVNVSDSENPQSTPRVLTISPSTSSLQPGTSPFTMAVSVTAGPGVKQGGYTVAVTFTNGGVQQTVYLFLTVT